LLDAAYAKQFPGPRAVEQHAEVGDVAGRADLFALHDD